MITSIRLVALCGLAVGLAACDSAQEAPVSPESADGLFDASLFPTSSNIIAVRNAPDAENRDRVFRTTQALSRKDRLYDEPTLEAALGMPVASFQQVAFARGSGRFYSTLDASDNTGRIVRANRRGDIRAVTTAGIAPKGVFVDIDVSTGFVGVADFGTGPMDSQILIYNENFQDGEAPVITITDLGTGGRAWDLFYSNADNILFVSKTNGEVVAYDNFVSMAQAFLGSGTPIMPTREFAISNPNDPSPVQESENLHGISYDDGTRVLVVSDVRDPSAPLSGQIYTVDDGDTAGGPPNPAMTPSTLVDFRARLRSPMGGNSVMLGNPVDVLGFGDDLYVAAKGTGKVLRFDNILGRVGEQGAISPDAMIDVQGAESVSFFNR